MKTLETCASLGTQIVNCFDLLVIGSVECDQRFNDAIFTDVAERFKWFGQEASRLYDKVNKYQQQIAMHCNFRARVDDEEEWFDPNDNYCDDSDYQAILL